ncbi:MAG: hypothetical protein IJS09_09060, partial [Treponema sp.]|nr:hypothetical protein [Treponema sp.]
MTETKVSVEFRFAKDGLKKNQAARTAAEKRDRNEVSVEFRSDMEVFKKFKPPWTAAEKRDRSFLLLSNFVPTRKSERTFLTNHLSYRLRHDF